MSNPQMETREFEVRLDVETRTITGLAVPYGQGANIGGSYVERFQAGAIDSSVQDVKLFYQHSEPIGKVLSGRDTADGFEITAHISETARGNEVYTLLRDGVLDKFSVGFIPVEQTRDGNTVTRTKVDLKEVSVVAFPAYSGASISEVREEANPVEDIVSETTTQNTESKEFLMENQNIENGLVEVREELAEVRRLAEAGFATTSAAPATDKFRSVGEYAKGLARLDDEAVELYNRATTSADAALRPAWVGYLDTLIDMGMPSLSAFSRSALPDTGLTIEWAKVNTNTIATGKQTTENTALTDGNISLTTVSTSVGTYGSQTSLSRQSIERSTVNYLDVAFRAMALGYAKKLNTEFIATISALTFPVGKTFDVTAGTAAAIIGGIVDGTSYIYGATGMLPEFLLVDPLAYKFLVTKSDLQGRPLVLQDGAGVNNIGSGNVSRLAGSIAGIPLIVDPSLAANTAYLANAEALTSYLNAGAPTRLSLEAPSTLTNTYAVYGYAAFAVPFEGAIVKIKVA